MRHYSETLRKIASFVVSLAAARKSLLTGLEKWYRAIRSAYFFAAPKGKPKAARRKKNEAIQQTDLGAFHFIDLNMGVDQVTWLHYETQC